MKYILLVLTSLAALGSSASIQRRNESSWRAPVRAYFEAVGDELKAIKASKATPPVCDFSSAELPVTDSFPLPPPSEGLSVYHVAVGRGTQVRPKGRPSPANHSMLIPLSRTTPVRPPQRPRRPSAPLPDYTTPRALPENSPKF